MIGAGAANIRTAKILINAGAKPENLFMADSKGVLNKSRRDLEEVLKKDSLLGKWKWDICLTTNKEGREGGVKEAMKGTDICIAASKPGPGVIKKEWVRGMSEEPIIFACANPTPEIWPSEAKEAGAKIVATGRSDFPNQINNALAFPGIFRGALDVRAEAITEEMCVAAAKELAAFAEGRGITEENIIPRMDEWMVYVKEAVACGLKAIDQGIARDKLSKKQLEEHATSMIKKSRESIKLLMKDKKMISLDYYIIDQGKKIRLIY
jgi:malate dehydrogenase (oxaloacetate-decarboxylating)